MGATECHVISLLHILPLITMYELYGAYTLTLPQVSIIQTKHNITHPNIVAG